ncbi:Crp/Fnr family transcriptional regulator [Niabella hibiscisoli]|uniref:Crp/Fnr family transcriptional regulator n=1 Tax=Niabella hibiscisoli TaxID=1825928 RepID=UPI001F0FC3B8|nr:Crp/Fnr family transcriptional regulator [Niabella hibiscisoli]MCH5717655.1 Crp/Fnr family transcriptional regulator [Niabella hibiscisoli]
MRIKKGNEAHHSFLHQHCMKEWWPALDTNAQVHQYKKGAIIFKEGDPVNGIYFMLSGIAKVHKLWDQEKELILRFAHNQDILGHRGLNSQHAQYPITATALSAVTLTYITLDFFEATFKTNKDFAYQFMMFMADELMLSEIRMRNLAHMTVRARLANALLAMEQKFGRTESGFIAFTISRQDIAAYVGTAYETVYKTMNEFTELGYIKTEAKAIALLDKTAIKNAVC